MNADVRLAEIVAALEGADTRCLVMGGHAVRFYGLNRNTSDFDLNVAPGSWEDLLPFAPAASVVLVRTPAIEPVIESRLRILWISQ